MPPSQQNHTASSNPIKRNVSGRSGPKARTGCRTCKIRKVKCNEDRPACHQCVSSGRVCDGYGIWGGGHSPYPSGSSMFNSPDGTTGSSVKVPISRIKPRSRREDSRHSRHSPMQPRSTDLSSSHHIAGDSSAQVALKPTQSLVFQPLQSQPISSPKRRGMLRSVPTSLAEFPAPARERRLLYWFQKYTVHKLPGLFPSSFWSSLLPQASYSEPAVLHAVVALTSAHKYQQPEPILLGRVSIEEQFTLQSYSQAIHFLSPHFSLQNLASLRVTLITCLLFVCLEIVQQHHVTAISHLSNGLRLLEQYEQSRGRIDGHGYLDVGSDDLICRMFLRLALQVNMLGSSHLPFSIMNRLVPDKPPNRFISIEEARKHLDILLAQVLEFNHLCRNQQPLPYTHNTLSPHQAALQANLTSWLEAFNTSNLEQQATSPRTKTSCMILRMYHTMAVIITATGISQHQQTLFDQQSDKFFSILSYAINSKALMIDSSVIPDFPDPFTEMQAAIIDIGWVPALYYTAIKCRTRRIRLHAIELLESAPHQEGFWDARMAAGVAREVMRVEEDGQGGEVEQHRVHDVQVFLANEARGRVGLLCRQRGGEVWRECYPIYNLD
ncbi:hypothetical protein BGW36DRAFT_430542 [Talaromyces proteolyticus]|uniref:Zn(2)-C6 fungal-type domain-containing protein n=1 Tax=Talaromyces proteolyticus TaxID=1131652 RepID=A0AAD4KNZ7_9EURO|nr:uncharacterized protein BGW36DRAFT_430542 [Talaromyces proteolyticus]KAH8692796.1 hypothetical protein BGW36DRAFT_430542 [Talaromyces proteolyticus]